MNQRWLLKAKRWAQNPPSPTRIKLIVAIIAVCLGLFAFETLWGWLVWLTPNRIAP